MPQVINGIKPQSSLPDEPKATNNSGLSWFSSWADNQRYQDQSFYQGVPTYWSSYRDEWLRQQYEGISFVNAVVANITKKLSSILPIIQAVDPDDDTSAEIAEIETELLKMSWFNIAEQLLTDLMTQDNGVFLEVMGSGEADQPIEPTATENGLFIGSTGLRHLDSGRCTRTGDKEFPVIYESEIDGKRYKLHYTRVIYFADQPSPRADLYGVGLCGLSRFIDEALTIQDVAILEREMYGSKPPTQLALGVDLPPEEVQKALNYARQQAIDKQLSRYTETPWIIAQGAPAGTKASDLIHLLTLKHLPDNWDKTAEFELAARLAALAFGVDTGEFWRGNTVGQTKADAQIQDEKGAAKFEAWFFSTMEQWLNGYYCSISTVAKFDREDDTQDKAQADIAKINAEAYKIYLESGVLSLEIIWQQMLERQEITQTQYDELIAGQSQEAEDSQPTIEEAKQLLLANRAKKKDLADDYQFEVDRLVEMALRGEISQVEFEMQMTNLIDEFGEDAFLEGVDLTEGETLTEDERTFLDEKLAVILLALLSFSQAIYSGEYEGRESVAMSRAELWGGSMSSVGSLGQLFKRDDTALMRWDIDPVKDHCRDCVGFDGEIKPRGEWRQIAIETGKYPQSFELECKGFYCGCSLVEVN